jgi:hypothetical protein
MPPTLESSFRREIVLRWLLAIGCFALLIYFFSPPWAAFRAWARVPELGGMLEVRRGASVLLQEAHPGRRIPDPLHGAIQWRLLFPAIGHGLDLPPAGLFGLADLGCVLVLAFVIAVLRRRGVGFLEAGLTAMILGAGSWFFASVCWLGYYDSWLVLGLLFVAFARGRWPVWLACLWAPWVDERFVIAMPLALVCRYLMRCRDPAPVRGQTFWRQEVPLPAGLTAAFVVVRLGILPAYSDANATIAGYLGGLHLAATPWVRVADGVWEGLRVGWALVLAAGLFCRTRRWPTVALGALTAAVMAVGLATAQDFSRSMMFVLPVGLLGAVGLLETRPRWLPGALRGGAVAALLLPAHLVMSGGVNPISSLYRELASLQSPPPAIMPELFELRGIHDMEQGNSAQALEDLSLAIRLADDPTPACKQRGVLFASAGRWTEARRDFDTMVSHEPRNPDGWFLRAQADLALHDGAAAQADFQQALAVAPQGWANRPDVRRFRQRLDLP